MHGRALAVHQAEQSPTETGCREEDSQSFHANVCGATADFCCILLTVCRAVSVLKGAAQSQWAALLFLEIQIQPAVLISPEIKQTGRGSADRRDHYESV